MLPNVATVVTMPHVMSAVAAGGTIHGYDSQSFIVEYLIMRMVTSFVTGHFVREIGRAVREGMLSLHHVPAMS